MQQYDVQIGFLTERKKRSTFKHRCDLYQSSMENVLNDFIDFYLKTNLKPDDVKKLSVSEEKA